MTKKLVDGMKKKYLNNHGVSESYNVTFLHGNEQLFASKYKLYLPIEELRMEICSFILKAKNVMPITAIFAHKFEKIYNEIHRFKVKNQK